MRIVAVGGPADGCTVAAAGFLRWICPAGRGSNGPRPGAELYKRQGRRYVHTGYRSWRCGNCGVLVVARKDRCSLCGAPREPESMSAVVEDRGYRTPCHIWSGPRDPGGYGRVNREGRWITAHRAAYEEAHGSLPVGVEPDHLCRQQDCVRLDHLEAVTHAENCRRRGTTKLTRQDVEAIRASRESDRVIAERYGVSASHIWRVRNGQRWRDTSGDEG